MSWGERSFFFQGAGSKDPPVDGGGGGGGGAIINVSDLHSRFVLTMRFGKQVIILSGKLRFEHLFSNIMIWFG